METKDTSEGRYGRDTDDRRVYWAVGPLEPHRVQLLLSDLGRDYGSTLGNQYTGTSGVYEGRMPFLKQNWTMTIPSAT